LSGTVSSAALGINDADLVVGVSSAIDGNSLATLWNGEAPTNLGTLSGGKTSIAFAINNLGEIVGSSDDGAGDTFATLWNGTTIVNLGALPGGKYSVARGINGLGQIVGYSDDGSGEAHAVLWTLSPSVPEPSTWAMMLLGFGVGFMAYRRKLKPALITV
jgi:probable HAF family extracellular repeat protein